MDPELGNPTQRKPKTAILNFVRYHTEVVAVAAFHFVKLRHNVTVFTREDEFDMGDVINPYFWKGFRWGWVGGWADGWRLAGRLGGGAWRQGLPVASLIGGFWLLCCCRAELQRPACSQPVLRAQQLTCPPPTCPLLLLLPPAAAAAAPCCRKFERFFEHFHEYDNIVVATFPTCHDPTLRELLRLRLPQRYIALVHNPELLNSTEVAGTLAAGDVRLLAISPHVGAYAREVLEAQNVQVRRRGMGWLGQGQAWPAVAAIMRGLWWHCVNVILHSGHPAAAA